MVCMYIQVELRNIVGKGKKQPHKTAYARLLYKAAHALAATSQVTIHSFQFYLSLLYK